MVSGANWIYGGKCRKKGHKMLRVDTIYGRARIADLGYRCVLILPAHCGVPTFRSHTLFTPEHT